MPDFAGRLMGYWPSYSQIKSVCRLAYLTWHDQGRDSHHAYIGYPFLYLYGLERRLFERRSEEHTSELQSLMRISYAVFCLTKKITHSNISLYTDISLQS